MKNIGHATKYVISVFSSRSCLTVVETSQTYTHIINKVITNNVGESQTLFCLRDCRLHKSVLILEVLWPAISTQGLWVFPQSSSRYWDGAQFPKLLLCAPHVAPSPQLNNSKLSSIAVKARVLFNYISTLIQGIKIRSPRIKSLFLIFF